MYVRQHATSGFLLAKNILNEMSRGVYAGLVRNYSLEWDI